MGIHDTQPSYMRAEQQAVAYAGANTDPKIEREFETLLNSQEQQLGLLVATMRRVEDLADRIGGAAPCGEGTQEKPSQASGVLGALWHQNGDREDAIKRLAQAMSRIERYI